MTVTRALVLGALAGVRDPELDRPITVLGFVASIKIKTGSRVRVELRLPTFFCAPNFAWLMVADARDAVAAIPGAGPIEVVLLDHFASDEINAGVAAAGSFAASFDSDGFDPEPAADGSDPELAALRTVFDRKAHLAAQERLARALVAAGFPAAGLADVSLQSAASAAPDATAGVVRRRERLGVQSAWAFCDEAGKPVAAGRMPGWLRFARTVRVSIDGNAGFCQGLLDTRYGVVR